MEEPLILCRYKEYVYYTSSFCAAVEKSDITDVVKQLNRYKRNLDEVQGTCGTKLLHLAVSYSRLDLIDYLLKHGCCINTQNNAGATPLMHAVKKRELEIITYLCRAGADVFLTDHDRKGPLSLISSMANIFKDVQTIIASSSKTAATIKLMTKALMDSGCTLSRVIYARSVKMTEFFINSGCDVHTFDPYDNSTALHVAVNLNMPEQVRLLLQHGANPNAKNANGRKPISLFKSNSKDILCLLLDAGADLYDRNDNMGLELIRLLLNGTKSMIKRILESSPNLTRLDVYGMTMLHYVVSNSQNGVAELFLSQSFDPNVREKVYGDTPLHKAAEDGNYKFIHVLLTLGADVNRLNYACCPPIFEIMKHDIPSKDRTKCCELFLAHGADMNMELKENIVQKALKFNVFPIIEHVAYQKALDLPITEENLKVIEAHATAKKFFDSFTNELEAMKKQAIMGSITYFYVLTESVENIVKCASYEMLESTFEKHNNETQPFAMNHSKVVEKLKLALDLSDFLKEKESAKNYIIDVLQIAETNAKMIVNFLKPTYITKLCYEYDHM